MGARVTLTIKDGETTVRILGTVGREWAFQIAKQLGEENTKYRALKAKERLQ